MDRKDAIGKRGEAIFTARIMSFCENSSPYFNPIFIGEKADSLDFLVEVLGVPSNVPFFSPRSSRPDSVTLAGGRRRDFG